MGRARRLARRGRWRDPGRSGRGPSPPRRSISADAERRRERWRVSQRSRSGASSNANPSRSSPPTRTSTLVVSARPDTRASTSTSKVARSAIVNRPSTSSTSAGAIARRTWSSAQRTAASGSSASGQALSASSRRDGPVDSRRRNASNAHGLRPANRRRSPSTSIRGCPRSWIRIVTREASCLRGVFPDRELQLPLVIPSGASCHTRSPSSMLQTAMGGLRPPRRGCLDIMWLR